MEPSLKKHKSYENLNIYDLNSDSTILIIAPQQYGKTTLINKIIQNKNNIFIFNPLKTEFQNSYISLENLKNDYYTLEQKENKTVIIENANNIFNYDINFIKEVVMNSRNLATLFITSQDYPELIQPELRCNFDYIIIGNNLDNHNLNRIYRWYCGMYPSFESFKTTYNDIMKNYRYMVIINKYNNNEKIKILNE